MDPRAAPFHIAASVTRLETLPVIALIKWACSSHAQPTCQTDHQVAHQFCVPVPLSLPDTRHDDILEAPQRPNAVRVRASRRDAGARTTHTTWRKHCADCRATRWWGRSAPRSPVSQSVNGGCAVVEDALQLFPTISVYSCDAPVFSKTIRSRVKTVSLFTSLVMCSFHGYGCWWRGSSSKQSISDDISASYHPRPVRFDSLYSARGDDDDTLLNCDRQFVLNFHVLFFFPLGPNCCFFQLRRRSWCDGVLVGIVFIVCCA